MVTGQELGQAIAKRGRNVYKTTLDVLQLVQRSSVSAKGGSMNRLKLAIRLLREGKTAAALWFLQEWDKEMDRMLIMVQAEEAIKDRSQLDREDALIQRWLDETSREV